MLNYKNIVFIVFASTLFLSSSLFAHPGRTASDGCHYCRTNCSSWGQTHGARHCHGSTPVLVTKTLNPSVPNQPVPIQPVPNQSVPNQSVGEAEYNEIFCANIGGRTETRHSYNYGSGSTYVKVDCETATTVWEGGLDKRSSLDSLQQALFFSILTGKQPGIVIYDTDGEFGRFEYRIKRAAQRAGVIFRSE